MSSSDSKLENLSSEIYKVFQSYPSGQNEVVRMLFSLMLQHNGGCQHVCNEQNGATHCTCHEGFQLEADERTCRDIDECRGGQNQARILHLSKVSLKQQKSVVERCSNFISIHISVTKSA